MELFRTILAQVVSRCVDKISKKTLDTVCEDLKPNLFYYLANAILRVLKSCMVA